MNLEQATKAIQNLPKQYEGDGNDYRNSPSCDLILKAPVLDVMTSYGLSYEDASALKCRAKNIDKQNYWKARVAQDKYWQEQEAAKKNVTWFGDLLKFIGGIVFIMCCFGGVVGIIIGLIICGIIEMVVDSYFSTKKQTDNNIKTSPLVKDGDLDKFYLNLYKKQQYKKRHS